MSLSLPAGDFCETAAATGYVSLQRRSDPDNDGQTKYEAKDEGWADVSEIPVKWTITGGRPSYKLTIDGETRDAAGKYEGATGTASVTCAMSFEDSYIRTLPSGRAWREFEQEPLVDAGIKTITATVKDGNGATADASLALHVILFATGSDAILEGGKTYRLFGHLITPPPGHNIPVGSTQEPSCDADYKGRCEEGLSLYVVGTPAIIGVWVDDFVEGARWRTNANGDWIRSNGSRAPDDLDRYLDNLMKSVDRYPQTATPP